MISVQFTPKTIETLRYEKTHHPEAVVRRRMEALYLKSQRLSHQAIGQHLGISRATLADYLKRYRDEGLEGLSRVQWYRPRSELGDWAPVLKRYFEAHPPHTLSEAKAAIERLTGLKRSRPRVGEFLHRLGLAPRKVGSLPRQALSATHRQAQEDFKKKALEPRLAQARAGQRRVYFVDAAHFVYGAFLSWVWSAVRLFVPTPSGRARLNVLGALEAVSLEVLSVVNRTYINSACVCQLLEQIKTAAGQVPVTVVLDNARYQRCYRVQNRALELDIELLFMPPYSPHLNLIERLWKFIKSQCLYSRHYDNFIDFERAILSCLRDTHTVHKNALSSLLTWNFQSFEKVKIIPL